MTEGRSVLPRLSDRMRLGSRELLISPYCIGLTQDAETIPAAFDAGVNFFFLTADMHWPLYAHTRSGLEKLFSRRPSVRDEVVVAIVSYCAQPDFSRLPFIEAVGAVKGLKRADVLVAGGVYQRDVTARGAVLRAHKHVSFLGARAAGATCHERGGAIAAAGQEWCDIAWIRYNASHAGARADLFTQWSSGRSCLLFGFKSTNGYATASALFKAGVPSHMWRPTIEDHYRFVLTRPQLDGILCAPANPAQLDALSEAIGRGPLTADEEEHMLALGLLIRGRARMR